MPRFAHLVSALLFLTWCTIAIAGAVAHEPWWDEAQAWLIARDAPLPELFTEVVRYEGHPPLWYLLLAVPAKLGLPYGWLKVAGMLGGAATTLLLLFGFPRVPLFVRALAPFAFFVAYQYTVVARSYVLLGPLLLLVARIYERRAARPILFAGLLILMSHVSVHGFAIACALGALFLFDLARRRIAPPSKRAIAIAVSAFALNGILLIAALWPPADSPLYTQDHSVLDVSRHVHVLLSVIPTLFWPPAGNESPGVAILMIAAAVVAIAILIAWFHRSGVAAPFVLAALGVYAVALRYFSQWHEGIFFFLILFGAVLTFQAGGAGRKLTIAAQIVLVLLLARHIEWTARSMAYDLTAPFTGSAATATFIREHGLHEMVVFGTGAQVIELQPYFEANLFDNYDNGGRAYWNWSQRNPWPAPPFKGQNPAEMRRFLDQALAARPDAIVLGGGNVEDQVYAPRLMRDPAYQRVASFGGAMFWKNAPNWPLTFHVFVRRDIRPGSVPRSVAR